MNKINPYLLFLLLLMAAGSAFGQTAIVPPRFASIAGGQNATPLSSSANAIQLLIHESILTQLRGTELTGISFRSPSSSSTSWPVYEITFPHYDIYLSGSVNPRDRKAVSADNIVGTQRQARSGRLVIPLNSYPAGGPSSFGPVIGFDTAYMYAGGNLLLEIRHNGNDAYGKTGNFRALDGISQFGSNIKVGDSILANQSTLSTSYTATTGFVAGTPFVVQFSYRINMNFIDSVLVRTQGGIPPEITTNGGSLQMEAEIFPAVSNQTVSWSLVPGTGQAAVSLSGMVTAQSNGTVWVKAVSVADTTRSDSMEITINQPVNSVTVNTLGNVPAEITTNGGSLQMEARVLPVSGNQAVTWNIIPFMGTGLAAVSATGLVTPQENGTVWVKAVSVDYPAKADSMEISISNQLKPVEGVTVRTESNVTPEITVQAGTLNMEAVVSPAGSSQAVTWSIVPGSGAAVISAFGQVGARGNGTVWAKAVSVQDPAFSDSLEITISNQPSRINELADKIGLKVYPNPVAKGGKLFLEVAGKHTTGNALLTLSDPAGNHIRDYHMNGQVYAPDLEGIASGVYMLRYTDAGNNIIIRITIL